MSVIIVGKKTRSLKDSAHNIRAVPHAKAQRAQRIGQKLLFTPNTFE
jgi:hypothetical protein